MTLFIPGMFIGTSSTQLMGKIECDVLDDEDWQWAAQIVSKSVDFGWVVGVPTGGQRFAHACRSFVTRYCSTTLIVDDVWTTGRSMGRARSSYGLSESPGFVLFARGELEPWCQAIFQGCPATYSLKEE